MRRRGRALRRRYGRSGTSSVRSFVVSTGPLGPMALAYDARGHVVNSIKGHPSDHENVLRRDARRHWPNAEERRP
jgi:hypothetical protein